MQISKQEVERVARLARLEIAEAETEAFSKQLSSILTYIETLKTLKTDGVEPTATVLEQVNVFREDKSRPSLPVEKAMANAPESEAGHFAVPKIINET
ncbi:MAG: Asp-tRNA(Asn)/Glu-tRNA(Gln) amidotransferase subunit GatC [Nitrospirae bacterium]|nr:Asp-tRNA(Asn)/Glu-tRNA(Gln) amidotransferase subunit GatC [Nitrospirota bacterium]